MRRLLEWRLWPLLYLDLRSLFKPLRHTHHHEPQKWKARPDFRRFDASVVRTETCMRVGETLPEFKKRRLQMPWRLWLYWKSRDGRINGVHVDWLWLPPRKRAYALSAPHQDKS